MSFGAVTCWRIAFSAPIEPALILCQHFLASVLSGKEEKSNMRYVEPEVRARAAESFRAAWPQPKPVTVPQRDSVPWLLVSCVGMLLATVCIAAIML